jgi:hypothetical protein
MVSPSLEDEMDGKADVAIGQLPTRFGLALPCPALHTVGWI